ncbi:putative F-box/LRR-repeat protein At3g28410 isoform X3 [Apium graveolens]|uniref:putative F-box/LRR-repeat protein At3g28410 isoform X1 n=1 Tax=Apium graveolens TaxID=4045 RepID=UPI003D79F316
MKKVRIAEKNKLSGIDRIGSLSDEVIHYILSFSDVQSAVQTSVLSKRWKFIWTTLPFLNFLRFGDSELENVNINLRHVKTISPLEKNRVREMFCALGGAKILTLDLETIEAFSVIMDFLVSSSSPFCNLKYVMVPQEYKESSMSSDLRCYLLGRSPKATIVTAFPQNNMILPAEVAPVTAQNVMLEEPLSAPTKVRVDSEKIRKTLSIDNVDMGVQEEHVVQNPVVDVHRVG